MQAMLTHLMRLDAYDLNLLTNAVVASDSWIASAAIKWACKWPNLPFAGVSALKIGGSPGAASTQAVKKAFDAANIPAELKITFNPSAVLARGRADTQWTSTQVSTSFEILSTAIRPNFSLAEKNVGNEIRHLFGGNFFIKSQWSDAHRFFVFHQSKEFETQILVNASTSIISFNISQFAHETRLVYPSPTFTLPMQFFPVIFVVLYI
ncbi:hypothetical protein C8F01DRAFT_540211 [Mycena amicta]|nr:hypothetical protein C8F01DRAFT_540211 [Mycena amicta]